MLERKKLEEICNIFGVGGHYREAYAFLAYLKNEIVVHDTTYYDEDYYAEYTTTYYYHPDGQLVIEDTYDDSRTEVDLKEKINIKLFTQVKKFIKENIADDDVGDDFIRRLYMLFTTIGYVTEDDLEMTTIFKELPTFGNPRDLATYRQHYEILKDKKIQIKDITLINPTNFDIQLKSAEVVKYEIHLDGDVPILVADIVYSFKETEEVIDGDYNHWLRIEVPLKKGNYDIKIEKDVVEDLIKHLYPVDEKYEKMRFKEGRNGAYIHHICCEKLWLIPKDIVQKNTYYGILSETTDAVNWIPLFNKPRRRKFELKILIDKEKVIEKHNCYVVPDEAIVKLGDIKLITTIKV